MPVFLQVGLPLIGLRKVPAYRALVVGYSAFGPMWLIETCRACRRDPPKKPSAFHWFQCNATGVPNQHNSGTCPPYVCYSLIRKETPVQLKDIRKIENLHVALWLLKDASWCSSWKALGVVMIIPTLAVALQIVWHSRKQTEDLIHNVAVCLWICANMIWMAGEFFLNDGTRGYAKVFFFAGLALLAGYYASILLRKCLSRPAPTEA